MPPKQKITNNSRKDSIDKYDCESRNTINFQDVRESLNLVTEDNT